MPDSGRSWLRALLSFSVRRRKALSLSVARPVIEVMEDRQVPTTVSFSNGLLTVDLRSGERKAVVGFNYGSRDPTYSVIKRRAQAFAKFTLTQDSTGTPLYRRSGLRIVLTPSLEDNYDRPAKFVEAAKSIAKHLPTSLRQKVIIHRSPSPEMSRKADAVDLSRDWKIPLKSCQGMELMKWVRHEYHGIPGDAHRNGSSVLSNDGYFVWADLDKDENRVVDENNKTAGNTKNLDLGRMGIENTSPLSAFRAALPNTH